MCEVNIQELIGFLVVLELEYCVFFSIRKH